MLDLKQLDIIEHGMVVQVLDRGADVLQGLQFEQQCVETSPVGLLDKNSETMQLIIIGLNLFYPAHHGRIKKPASRKTRLQIQLVEHIADAARRFYDILQLHG